MAKYSTNRGSGGGNGDSCELCGRSTAKLQHANMAGADLLICPGCASHGENRHADRKSGSNDASCDGSSGNRKRRATQRIARLYDNAKDDSKRWEEKGTSYERDRLPYLVSGYDGVAEPAWQDAGLQLAESADEFDLDEKQLLTTKQGRVTRTNVGGSAIRVLEERLDMTLVDE